MAIAMARIRARGTSGRAQGDTARSGPVPAPPLLRPWPSGAPLILAVLVGAISGGLLPACPALAEAPAAVQSPANGLSPAACRPGQIPVPPGGTLTFEGDSLTYGFDRTETDGLPPINAFPMKRSRLPFPEEVGRLMGGSVVVVNHGYPGDRSAEGLARWRDAPTTALTVILFGTNDFGNYGRLAAGPLDPQAFRQGLEALVDRRLAQGGRVLLLTPPPLGNSEADRRLEAYRAVVREVAQARGLPLVDTAAAMQDVDPAWTDRLHLSRQANAAIAAQVAMRICLAP